MRIFLVGQKWLGAETVARLIAEGFEIIGARAPEAEDRLARLCRERGILVSLRPDREAVEPEEIPDGTDLILCAHGFAWVTPAAVARARHRAIGYHTSLLPEFPGRRAVEAAVAAGRKVTGGTVYRLTERYDAGPILKQRVCVILPGETAAELWRRALAPLGVEMLLAAARSLRTEEGWPP